MQVCVHAVSNFQTRQQLAMVCGVGAALCTAILTSYWLYNQWVIVPRNDRMIARLMSELDEIELNEAKNAEVRIITFVQPP